jgi:hypothetical protein
VNVFVLAFLGLTHAADPIGLPEDVYEIQSRRFAMPLRADPDRREKTSKMMISSLR